jgi:DNA gyrase subunit A
MLRGVAPSLSARKADIEEIRKDRKAIVVSEIPYQVNKATLQERIADLVRSKQMEGIADIRDESDRSGMRVVIEIKRDATPEVVLNQLYRFTPASDLVRREHAGPGWRQAPPDGPEGCAGAFITFREEVILRRARFELNKARDRGHILVGLVIAVANIDAVIALIRAAPDAATARESLMAAQWDAAMMWNLAGPDS